MKLKKAERSERGERGRERASEEEEGVDPEGVGVGAVSEKTVLHLVSAY